MAELVSKSNITDSIKEPFLTFWSPRPKRAPSQNHIRLAPSIRGASLCANAAALAWNLQVRQKSGYDVQGTMMTVGGGQPTASWYKAPWRWWAWRFAQREERNLSF